MTPDNQIHPTGKPINPAMEKDLKTGGFGIPLTKADKESMAKKNIIAMGADFLGHFCIVQTPRMKKPREQKERFNSPQEAIAAIK